MSIQLGLKRRRALLSLLGLATQSKAFGLSPKVPDLSFYVGLSQYVVVAKVERFLFRGVMRSPGSQEFDRDFEGEGNSGTRAMDVVLSVERVLFRKAPGNPPATVRIQWPIDKEKRANVIGSRRIVLLRQEHKYTREDGTTMEMHTTVISPLPIEHEKQALEAISKVVQR